MNEHGHDKEILAKMESEWNKQEVVMAKILERGADEFLREISVDESSVENHETVCCMDEGAAHIADGENKFAMAGSGILYPVASWEERLDRVADLYIKLGIKKITSHDGCGAAGIAWKNNGGKEGTGCETPDAYGRLWVSSLEEVMRKKGAEVVSTNIASDEMERPKEFHNARVVWFDGIGDFNPDKLGNKIPKGFLIEYGLTKENASTNEEGEYPFAELQVAINIALGDHGFGKKFTKDSPFLIIVLAKNAAQLEEIRKKIEPMIEKYNGVVKLDGRTK